MSLCIIHILYFVCRIRLWWFWIPSLMGWLPQPPKAMETSSQIRFRTKGQEVSIFSTTSLPSCSVSLPGRRPGKLQLLFWHTVMISSPHGMNWYVGLLLITRLIPKVVPPTFLTAPKAIPTLQEHGPGAGEPRFALRLSSRPWYLHR